MNTFSTEILTANAAVFARPVLGPLSGAIPLGMAGQMPDKPRTPA